MGKAADKRPFEWVLDLLAVLFPLSEIGKQFILTSYYGFYVWWYFPFQLCSMPLYLLPLRQLLVRREDSSGKCSRAVTALSDFLADFCLLGGIFVFFDQSGMHYAVPILTVHSYAWHLSMIFLGCFLILSGRHSGGYLSDSDSGGSPVQFLKGSMMSYAPAALLLLGFAAVAECINALCHTFGSINMFYISPWEPVTQVVFCDIADRIGVLPEILLYLGCLLLGGLLFHMTGCLLTQKCLHSR